MAPNHPDGAASATTYGVGYPLTLAVAGQRRRLAADRCGRSCQDLVNGDGHDGVSLSANGVEVGIGWQNA